MRQSFLPVSPLALFPPWRSFLHFYHRDQIASAWRGRLQKAEEDYLAAAATVTPTVAPADSEHPGRLRASKVAGRERGATTGRGSRNLTPRDGGTVGACKRKKTGSLIGADRDALSCIGGGIFSLKPLKLSTEGVGYGYGVNGGQVFAVDFVPRRIRTMCIGAKYLVFI